MPPQPPAPVEAELPLPRSVDVPPVAEEPVPPVVPEVLVLGDGLGDAEAVGSAGGLGDAEGPSPARTSTANWVMASPTDAATVYVPVPSPAVREGIVALPESSVLTRTTCSPSSKRGRRRWRSPRPAQPGPVNALFRPGVRVTDGYHLEMTVVQPRRAGTLRLPSGLLAVSGPDTGHGDGPHITVPVAPGEYVLDEARVRYSYHCEWRNAEVTTTQPTAVRLLVSDTPAATWEMAVGPQDDPRLFIERQTAGFVTDGATGCFADAGAWEPLIALFERGLVRGEPDLDGYEDIDDDSMFMQRTWDEVSGGEFVSFATTGDGTYPVRVGRCEAGEVTGVVVLVEGMPELLPERDGLLDAGV